VKIVAGRVKKITSGRTNEFRRDITTATIMIVVKESSTCTPGRI
jgi:hypothetical protein